MATIERSTSGVGFFVRWSKQGSDNIDYDAVDDETDVIEKNTQDKEMAAVLGVAVPFLKESVISYCYISIVLLHQKLGSCRSIHMYRKLFNKL